MTPTADPSPTAPGPRNVHLALGVLLLVCLGMRIWYASAGLDPTRFFDERFSFRNVANVLLNDTMRPANAYYGSLSYLPQAAVLWVSQELHELTGISWLAVFDERAADGWSKTAYFLVRLVCGVFGTLSVWLTFLVGRRLFSPAVGLLGGALLTAFPRHVLASTEFKPDILVVVLVLLAFLWSLDLARAPSVWRFVKAGGAVGLAVAAKYTGVGAAIPLAAGVLYGGWRDHRRWLGLGAAGLASVLAFFVLNPHVTVIFEYLPRIWGIMESKGEATGGSHWTVVWLELRFLVLHHRWPVALFAAAGLAGLAGRAVGRLDATRERRREAWMVLSYVFGYSALYAAATKLFKGQNYLPVAAFTSLLAAWAMLEAWRWLRGRLPVLGRRPLAAAAWGAFLVWLFAVPMSLIYADVVPSTHDRVEKLLARSLRPLEARRIVYEHRDRPITVSTPGGHWLAAVPVERLPERDASDLDRADAEVFFAERLEGDEAELYLRRALRPGVVSRRFEPRPFATLGPARVVLLHPWKLLGEPQPLALETAGTGRFRAELPEPLAAGEVFSLTMWLPLDKRAKPPREVAVSGREAPLHTTRRGGRRAHLITPRIDLPEATAELVLTFPAELGLPQAPEVQLLRWRPPGS